MAVSSWLSRFELGPLLGQLAVQRGDPRRGDQAGLEVVGVERLDEVVVGAGAHALEDLVVAALAA